MQQGELDRLVGAQDEDPILIERQELPPVGTLRRIRLAVGMPERIATSSIDFVHVLVTLRIIDRHWWAVLIEGVVHAAMPIDFNSQGVRRKLLRIANFFFKDAVCLMVGLRPVVRPMTGHGGRQTHPRDHQQGRTQASTARRAVLSFSTRGLVSTRSKLVHDSSDGKWEWEEEPLRKGD